MIEYAGQGMPGSIEAQQVRAVVYGKCIERETSLIGKALFSVYRREALARSKE